MINKVILQNRDYDTDLEVIRKLWEENNVLHSDVLDNMNAQHEVTETVVTNNNSGAIGE